MGAFGFTSKPVEREVVVSTLDGVKSFVAKPDRRVVLVGGRRRGGRDPARRLRRAWRSSPTSPTCSTGRPAERPDCVVVEPRRCRRRRLIEQLKQARRPVGPGGGLRAATSCEPRTTGGCGWRCSAAWCGWPARPSSCSTQATPAACTRPEDQLPANGQGQARPDPAGGRRARRPQGRGHRRRHPQHLLAGQRARGVRRRAALRRERPGGPGAAAARCRTPTSCWSTS